MHRALAVVALWACAARARPSIPTVEVAPGVHLPMITMGGVNTSVNKAYPDPTNYSLWLELGGRGFDTAWEYRTQRAIAAAVKGSGLQPADVFVTTKIPGSLHGGCCGCPGAKPPGEWPPCLPSCHGVCFPAAGHYNASMAEKYIEEDLAALGVETIDLLLLHEPCDYIAPYPYNASEETSVIYGAMERALASGKARAIGVSNFNAAQLADLARTNKVVPAVNQCSLSVGGVDTATAEYCREHGIVYQAYGTLHGKGVDISHDTTLSSIAAAHGASNFQVVMRWVTQHGWPLVTASNVTAYDEEDFGVFGFNLTAAEMASIDALKPPPPPTAPGCTPAAPCPDRIDDCVQHGCRVCPNATGQPCGSCGCVECCGACKLATSKGTAYCAPTKSDEAPQLY